GEHGRRDDVGPAVVLKICCSKTEKVLSGAVHHSSITEAAASVSFCDHYQIARIEPRRALRSKHFCITANDVEIAVAVYIDQSSPKTRVTQRCGRSIAGLECAIAVSLVVKAHAGPVKDDSIQTSIVVHVADSSGGRDAE